MKILKEKDLPLLKRKRITAELEHFKKPTPKEADVLKSLADTLKTSEDTISILHLYPHFGREKTKIIANVYGSKEDKDHFEKINKNPLRQKKKASGEEKPAEEAPKKEEAKPAETPKETPKEEKKPEEKPKEEKK